MNGADGVLQTYRIYFFFRRVVRRFRGAAFFLVVRLRVVVFFRVVFFLGVARLRRVVRFFVAAFFLFANGVHLLSRNKLVDEFFLFVVAYVLV